MNLSARALAALATLICLPWAAQAAGNTSTVYRCGQTYQQTPCPAGQAVEVKDERDAGQQADAKKALAADKALAKDLAAERREREKAVKPQTRAAGVAVSPAGPAASAPAEHEEDPCQARGGKHIKAKKIKCAGGLPVYKKPAEPKAKESLKP